MQVHLNTEVSKVEAKDGKVTGVLSDGEKKLFPADAVLVATGGISYKTTGSTGDGYRFAEELGHKVTELYPSLVPFNTKEAWAKSLQGLSLKNVDVKVMDGKKKLYDGFWRDDVHPLWRDWSSDLKCQQLRCENGTKKRTFTCLLT